MLLSDIFIALSTGELSQVVLGNSEDQDIAHKDQPKVISAINLAMTELYKKFQVREKTITIEMHEEITLYTLSYDFAFTNTGGSEPVKYIIDTTGVPFDDDVLRIHTVYDADGDEIILNNLSEDTSLFTPSANTLNVPTPVDDTFITLSYRVKPIEIPKYGIDPAVYEIELPDYLLEPLLFYVASRVMPNMGPNSGEPTFFQKYLGSCENIKKLDLWNRENFTNDQLEQNGWV